MTGGKRDRMGRCEMNGWLTKGQIRRRKMYYRLHGPFLSEHDDERSPSDTAIWIQNAKVTRLRGSIRIELPGRKKMVLNSPSVDQVDGWFLALNAAARRQFADHYTFKAMLKKSVAGMFLTGEDRQTSKPVMIKVINKKNYTPQDVRKLQRELRVALTLTHPHIVSTIDVFDADQRLFVILEHHENAVSLVDECERFGILPEEVNRKIAKGLLSALTFLHSLDIIHGEVNLDNVICTAPLTNENWDVKLMDYGYGAMLDPEPRYQMVKDVHQHQDSWYYIAPEQLRRGASSAIDVWAVGICLFYMFYRKYPFQGTKISETLQKIRSRTLAFPPDAERVSSVQATLFMQTLLEKNVMQRCTAKNALRNKWIYSRNATSLVDTVPTVSAQTAPALELKARSRTGLRNTAGSLPPSVAGLGQKNPMADGVDYRESAGSVPPPTRPISAEEEEEEEEEMIFSFHLHRGGDGERREREAGMEKEAVDLEAEAGAGDTPRVLRWQELPKDESGMLLVPEQYPALEAFRERSQAKPSRAPPSQLVLQQPLNRSDVLDRRVGSQVSDKEFADQRAGSQVSDRELMRGGSSDRQTAIRGRSRSRMDDDKSLLSMSISRSLSGKGQPVLVLSRTGTGPDTDPQVYELDAYENRWFG